MTLNELIETLEEIRDDNEELGEHDVRLMTQQNYPLQASLRGVWAPSLDGGEDEDDNTIYLVEGGSQGYGTSEAWENCRR